MKLIRIHVNDREPSDDSYYVVDTLENRWALADRVAEMEDEYGACIRAHQTEAADKELEWQEYDVDDKEDYVVRGLKAQGYKIFPVEVIDRYWDNAPEGD